uniref:Alternative oxidase n=1 Tax=Rhizophagus irregularis TaxID=588596 RepID=A0A0S2GYG1_9GLOM|nr:mitochondrial alternative oxidase [Rhizophagus irregularis]
MIRSVFHNTFLRNTTTFTETAINNAGHYHKSILPQNSMFLLTRAFTIHASRMQSANATISGKEPDVIHQIPEDLFYLHHPKPVRHEIIESKAPLDSKALENIDINPDLHRQPVTWSDKIAFYTVKTLRIPTDWLFKKKYIHRAVMLETVAAVPGMVGATIRHLRSLRKLQHDGGWIDHLLHEAENERMHLMTWMRISQPTWWERSLITLVQGGFYNMFFMLYLISPRTAHRVVGYLEEEAIVSYNSFLKEIDNGNIENSKNVPDIAIDYWNLDKNSATLRDVVLAVRADEATHRDTNHHFADRILVGHEDLREDIKRAFENHDKTKKMAGLTNEAPEKWKWSK